MKRYWYWAVLVALIFSRPLLASEIPEEMRLIPADAQAEQARAWLAEQDTYELVFCGVGHTFGIDSFWEGDTTIQGQACGDNPWGIPGSCWWRPELTYHDKNGSIQVGELEQEWWDSLGAPALQFHPDIIGSQEWYGSGCLVISAHIPFTAFVRSYNSAHPAGQYGYRLEPARLLERGEVYQWGVNVEGGRGNCFTYNPEFVPAQLTVTRGYGTNEEEVRLIPIAPGCRLHTGFEFGDRFEVQWSDDIHMSCSAMAPDTSDGTAAELIPLVYE